MHGTLVRLTDGKSICGSIWRWCPKEGWFELTDDATGNLVRIELRDVHEGNQSGQRVSVNSPPEGENVDLIQRAKKDGWDGT